MKFHLDENVEETIADGLRLRGFDVTTTSGQGLKGASDESQLRYCLESDRVIVSHDPDILRLAAAGLAHAGIAFRPAARNEVGLVIRRLMALANRVGSDAFRGRVEFL